MIREPLLIGGLLVGVLSSLPSCVETRKKDVDGGGAGTGAPARKAPGAKQGAGSGVAARRGTPAGPARGAAGLGRYRSCDELQQAVYRALRYKKQSDDAYLAEQRRKAAAARRAARRTTGRGARTTAAAPARAQAAPPAAAASKGGRRAPAAKKATKKLEQFTNVQEVGVDEPDHVKIGPHNIYLLRGLEIQVADRETLRHVGRVQLSGLTRAKKLLITAERLFVLGEVKERICAGRPRGLQPPRSKPRGRRPRHGRRAPRAKRSWLSTVWRWLVPEAHAVPGSMRPRPRPRPHPGKAINSCVTRVDTVVQALKLSRGKTPALVRSWRFKGRYVDARMTAGRIVLIFRQFLNLVPQVRRVLTKPSALLSSVPRRPIQLDAHRAKTLLSCSAIYRSNMSDQDYRLTKVVAIDASELSSAPKQAGFVGGGDQIYMSTKNLYISKVGKRWLPRGTARRARAMRDGLVVTQVGFDGKSGEIAVLAQTDSEIKGRPKDQWAFKELEHEGTTLLGVFTTTGKMWSKNPAEVTNNYLWILRRSGSELAVAAKLEDIAPGESIRSLRYIGDWAYAVTFKKTDPLFAIDLSDPLSPKIVGELKIPGFSTYMHPVGEGKLIGIGFDVYQDAAAKGKNSVKFQGIKLSLFDISDPRDMRELDTLSFGGRGSYSDVTADHHAFFYDAQLKRLAFPLTLLEGKSKTGAWHEKARRIGFAGAVLVQVGRKKLRELAKWRHNVWIPKKCYEEMRKGRWWEARTESLDISRIYRIGQRYVTVSRYGLKGYGVRSPQLTRQRLRFPGDFVDCGVARPK